MKGCVVSRFKFKVLCTSYCSSQSSHGRDTLTISASRVQDHAEVT